MGITSFLCSSQVNQDIQIFPDAEFRLLIKKTTF